MREQVPHRRAGRAGGLVEVDDALLRGDQHRERRDGFDTEASRTAREVLASVERPGRIDDTGGGELDRPVVDLAKCLHAPRY